MRQAQLCRKCLVGQGRSVVVVDVELKREKEEKAEKPVLLLGSPHSGRSPNTHLIAVL